MTEGERRECVGCHVMAPHAGEVTLLSARFGWRLIRRSDGSGGVVLEWRCPTCAERARTGRRAAIDPSALAVARADETDESKTGHR